MYFFSLHMKIVGKQDEKKATTTKWNPETHPIVSIMEKKHWNETVRFFLFHPYKRMGI